MVANLFEYVQMRTEKKLGLSNMSFRSGYIYVGSTTSSLRVAIATY